MYSSQLIEELEKNLNKHLIVFFEQKHNILEFKVHSISELIEYALNQSFKGASSKEELVPLAETLRRTRIQKRRRWYNTFMTKVTSLNINDSKHPLSHIVSLTKSLSIDAYVQLYGNKTIEEIIQEEVVNTEIWKCKDDFFLIDFPGISSYTHNAIFSSFVLDVAYNLWEYAKLNLHSSLDSYLVSYPETLVDKPLFGSTSGTMLMQDVGNNILKSIVVDENNNSILEITMQNPETGTKLISSRTLSAFDLKILNALIMNATMKSFCTDHTVTVSFSQLASHIIDYRPSKKIYDKIEESCKQLVQYSYTYIINDKHQIYFNLVDHVKIDRQKNIISCTFGEVVSDAIIQKELITITLPVYSKLKSNLSSIICYALKKEQIVHQSTLFGEYPYVYFQRIVYFKTSNRRNNIKLLKESLQEFVDNQVIIDKFSVTTAGVFEINFLSLSPAELHDLNIVSIIENKD